MQKSHNRQYDETNSPILHLPHSPADKPLNHRSPLISELRGTDTRNAPSPSSPFAYPGKDGG